jgi:hypothetical protein
LTGSFKDFYLLPGLVPMDYGKTTINGFFVVLGLLTPPELGKEIRGEM